MQSAYKLNQATVLKNIIDAVYEILYEGKMQEFLRN
jgi:hypothetical protein